MAKLSEKLTEGELDAAAEDLLSDVCDAHIAWLHKHDGHLTLGLLAGGVAGLAHYAGRSAGLLLRYAKDPASARDTYITAFRCGLLDGEASKEEIDAKSV